MMTGWNAICQSAVSAKICYNRLNFYLSRKAIKTTKHDPRFRNITAEYKLRMDNNSVSFILSSKYINKYLVKLLNLVQHWDSKIITLQHFTRKYNTASFQVNRPVTEQVFPSRCCCLAGWCEGVAVLGVGVVLTDSDE